MITIINERYGNLGNFLSNGSGNLTIQNIDFFNANNFFEAPAIFIKFKFLWDLLTDP